MPAPLVRTSTPGIYRRAKRYVVKERDGFGRMLTRSAATMTEAKNIKADIRSGASRGIWAALGRTTFADYAEEWLATYAGRTSRGIRPTTIKDYRRYLERKGIPFFGSMSLTEISPRDIKRFMVALQEDGLARNSVRLHVAPVRALFATAFEDGLVQANPAAGLRNMYGVVPENERVNKALTDDELDRLLAAARPEHRLILRFLSETGLRIGEAVAVQWRDVDLELGRVHITRRYYAGTVDTPKSRYGVRTVPLDANMLRELSDLRKRTSWHLDHDHVFSSARGTALDGSNVLERMMKPAAVAAGVPWAHLHTLRHTCATRLFRSGWNAKQVQMMLGHHSPAFTLATYVHLMPEDLPTPSFGGAVAAVAESAPTTQH